MIQQKVNDFRLALKKFVSRLLILTAIVVFGAIAIAQAPKDKSNAKQIDATPAPFVGEAKPIGEASEAVVPVAFTASETEADADVDFLEDSPAVVEASYQAQPDAESNDFDLPPAETLSDEPLENDAESSPYYDETAPPLLPSEEEPAEQVAYGQNPYRTPADESPLAEPPAEFSDPTPAATDVPARDPNRYAQEDNESSAEFADEAIEVPADDVDLSYDEEDLLPADSPDLDEETSADESVADFASPEDFNSDLSSDETYLPSTDEQAPTQPFDNSEGNFSPVPDRSHVPQNNGVAVQDLAAPPQSRQPGQMFSRSTQIERNPLPQYEIARRNNNIRATGRPGPRNLEGPQTPSLTIEKIAPSEVQVGKPANFQIKVVNVGQVPANHVVIRDEVPEGTTFIQSSPEAQLDEQGALLWEVGTINPGDESVVTVELMPTSEGQVGSVATVSFEGSATARARSTKPALALEHSAPKKVLLGEPVKFTIKLSNPGSGAATQVVLEEDVPAGLSHSSGPKLEYEVGTVLPGKTRHLELTLVAAQPGRVVNELVARGDAGLLVKDTVELEVVAPQIQVKVDGPKRRYLEREATFTVAVANPGTAAAEHVELVAELPKGLRFVSTNNSGYYDPTRHAIIWNLEQLPAGEMGRAQFKAVPIAMGDFTVRAHAKADRKLTANQEHQLRVEGIAALYYGVADKVDPVEVGGETTYVITVENQGSKTASNIRFAALVPEGMKPISGGGNSPAIIRGQQVMFEPIATLPPKAKSSFQIIVQGVQPGDQKLRVQMTSDDISTPVIKEEATRVYAD